MTKPKEDATVARESSIRTRAEVRTVELRGMAPLMFDRYPGDNDTKLEWWQKVYLRPDTNLLVLPLLNIVSFLCSHNTNSAPKRLRDSRKFKKIANACLSYVEPNSFDGSEYIPIERDGKPIEMGKPSAERDEKSGLYLHKATARLEKGIPNPKERPVLPLPWSLTFRYTFYPNKEIKEQEVKNLIEEGGVAIGLGTFRGVYGKFEVARWE